MMEKTLTLPRLGETMEEGTVLTWSKISGEEYDRGDILLELETDKMVVEVPALEDGKILEILADEGAVVAIGDSVNVFIDDEGKPTPMTQGVRDRFASWVVPEAD